MVGVVEGVAVAGFLIALVLLIVVVGLVALVVVTNVVVAALEDEVVVVPLAAAVPVPVTGVPDAVLTEVVCVIETAPL